MSKNSKKNKGSHHKTHKTSTPAVHSVPESKPPEAPVTEEPRKLELKTLIGTIDTDLYERLLKPAISSFALRHDDEPLRQVVESIVTSIAMHDAYEGYRKIDDIFQRYLYYLESIAGSSRKNLESIELSALCDYWRTQVLMTLIRNSSDIFDLFLPNSQPESPKACTLLQADFFHGITTALNNHIDPAVPVSRDSAFSRDLFDFAHGISFPWLGFPPENVFSLQSSMANETIDFVHEFAIASNEQTHVFDKDARNALNSCLLNDLIFAQHHKMYDEISQAFAPEDQLPEPLKEQLAQRIRFDKTYQDAHDAILCGRPLSKPLHRSSRLDIKALNAFGKFASLMHRAFELSHGVYIFHFVG